MKKTYGYARVSTREQHLDRQLKALMDAGVEERDIITDKVSGKDLEREGYQSLKNHFLRDGDTKSTIKIGLQSLAGASPHIKVTLYKSNGVSVATTMNLPWSSPMSGGTTYVSFTNLDTAYNYYAVIQNMDTVQTGTILGIAKQKITSENSLFPRSRNCGRIEKE